ncbi:unnamed protein product [Calypogeia fissa]
MLPSPNIQLDASYVNCSQTESEISCKSIERKLQACSRDDSIGHEPLQYWINRCQRSRSECSCMLHQISEQPEIKCSQFYFSRYLITS